MKRRNMLFITTCATVLSVIMGILSAVFISWADTLVLMMLSLGLGLAIPFFANLEEKTKLRYILLVCMYISSFMLGIWYFIVIAPHISLLAIITIIAGALISSALNIREKVLPYMRLLNTKRN